jgi:hypothetical protein
MSFTQDHGYQASPTQVSRHNVPAIGINALRMGEWMGIHKQREFYSTVVRRWNGWETRCEYIVRHRLHKLQFRYFNTCTVRLVLFCTMTNKCTIISQIITLLHVSTLSCHHQGACQVTQVLQMQLLVIQFKIISHRFYAVEISMFKIFKILQLSYL